MQRKIIQVATIPADLTSASIIALCDDGSLHCLNTHKQTWSELPPIPQKKVERDYIGQKKD